jgi:hypothetical protein
MKQRCGLSTPFMSVRRQRSEEGNAPILKKVTISVEVVRLGQLRIDEIHDAWYLVLACVGSVADI